MLKKLLLLLLPMAFSFASQAQLKINEYSCSNINTITDAYGSYEDWVEVFNAGASAVNLTGYYLSDNPNNLTKWQIPSIATNVNPGGFQMIFCSGNGLVNGSQIHTDFHLTQTKGEWFLLSDPSGNLIDSVHLNLTQRGHSRGRTTNGAATFSLFTTPSPNASNAGGYLDYATKPIFSLAPGFYNAAQVVSISSPDPNVTIYYTLDGSTPTAASTPFTVPINVTVGAGPIATVIRAKAFSTNAQIVPSFVETNTYITNETTTMNVISLCGAANTLFTSGSPYLSYEFFDKNRNFIEEFEGLARRHGHDSWAYPQKGFKIYASDESGYQAEYDYKYFRTSTRNKFDMLIFKAGASDNYNGNGGPSCHLRDAFAHTLAEKYNLEMDFRRYEPTIIYINGQYWGIYEIRERVDKEHKKYYYGKDKPDLDQLQNWGGLTVTAGSSVGWTWLFNYITTNNMAVPANYQIAKDSLNMKSFCQYLIFNQYLVNSDWLNWNTMWWRARGNNPIKWRYALWDCDNILDLGQNYTGLGTTTFNNDPCDITGLFQGGSGANNGHAKILNALMVNPEFKNLYEQQWLDLLMGPFDCTNIQNHFDSIKAIIAPEIPRQVVRWPAGGASVADWNSNIAHMQAQITGRCAVIASSLADTNCFGLNPQPLKLNVSPTGSGIIDLNSVTKSPYVWSGLLKADSTYNLKATPTAGAYWTFDHWEKQEPTNTINPNTTTDLITFNFKNKDSVIAYFKYFNYDSVDVTFDVNPPGTGTIKLNGNTIPTYPSTIKLDRRNLYDIVAQPMVNHKFLIWQKNNANTTISPNLTDRIAKLKYLDAETVVANFEFLPPPPPLPELTSVDKRVFIPNAFSPNEDGKNDVFTIRVGKDAIGMDMSIIDRWGNVVYNTNDITKGWNGMKNGRNADVGTYQYLIKVRFRDQSIETYKGDLSLIR